jgi:hypothetical protein
MDLIIRVVGKEGAIRIATAGGKSTGAGDKHPMIGIAHHRHEKGSERVKVFDAVEWLAFPRHR